MKKTLTAVDPLTFPKALRPYLRGEVYDSSCSRDARVLYLRDSHMFLKCAAAGTLAAEAEMTAYFHSLGLSVEVLDFCTEGEDFLLTAAADGEDATHPRYLADGRRLAAALGERLRALHETAADGCPVPDRTTSYLAAVREGARAGRFDPTFLPKGCRMTAEEALATVRAAAPQLTGRVLLHGDYCLPNILFEDWQPSGFIDLGAAGIGDPHIDLFWGAWTLRYNLGTDEYRETFFSAYGRDRIRWELLSAIAAAECFA